MIHPILAKVTQNLIERSREARAASLRAVKHKKKPAKVAPHSLAVI